VAFRRHLRRIGQRGLADRAGSAGAAVAPVTASVASSVTAAASALALHMAHGRRLRWVRASAGKRWRRRSSIGKAPAAFSMPAEPSWQA
jgi:hypothetical protein